MPKDVRLNLTQNVIMKNYDKTKLQNVAVNHLADTDYKYFLRIYRKCTSAPYSFLTIDTALSTDDPLHFRRILLDALQNNIS